MTLAFAVCSSTAFAQIYTIVPIPVPGANYVAGEEVNDLGVVGGGAFDSADLDGGFRLAGSMVTPMPTLAPGKGVYGNSINNVGVVAGYAFNDADERRAVVWDGAMLINLGTLGGDRSNAFGINSAGVVVGSSRNAAAVNRPFRWTPSTGMVELPITLGGASASARAINDAGLIAATARNASGDDHAVLFDSTTSTTLDLGTLGGPASFSNGLSPNGYVVGLSDAPNDEFRPFFWSSATELVDLFASSNLGQPFGAAYDVNSSGQVVGYGEIDLDFNSHAFVWSASAGLENLNDLIVPGSGWELLGASGINESGQITGWGKLDGVPTGFLLTPVPEPATLTIFGGSTAILLLGAAARRRPRATRQRRSCSLPVVRLLLIAICLLSGTRQSQANEVTFWNDVLLQSVRTERTPPPRASRAMAIMHAAAFDAVNSISRAYVPYHQYYSATPSDSAEAAVAQASHDVLAAMFPDQHVLLSAALDARLDALPFGPSRDAGVALGSAAAAGVLDLRTSDNSDMVVAYLPGSLAGEWKPTAPAFAPALLPNWPLVTPWTMSSGSQFRDPHGPPALDSAEYAEDLAEVRELGSATSLTRTADQTEIARFWADGAGTATPPGHWNRIAQGVVAAKGLSLIESARTFALLNLGLADAAIVSWDNKYEYDFWRPITAIREDGISPDPSWTPLLTTPPFPGYTSGHSTFSGAASTILASVFGDTTSFASTQDNDPLTTRSFTSFSQAAYEAADSRLFGGIHFGIDNDDGLVGGQLLGRHVVATQLHPVPEPVSLPLVLAGVAMALRRRGSARRVAGWRGGRPQSNVAEIQS